MGEPWVPPCSPARLPVPPLRPGTSVVRRHKVECRATCRDTSHFARHKGCASVQNSSGPSDGGGEQLISRKRGLLSVLALLVAVLALIAAGCGGDDEEGSGDGHDHRGIRGQQWQHRGVCRPRRALRSSTKVKAIRTCSSHPTSRSRDRRAPRPSRSWRRFATSSSRPTSRPVTTTSRSSRATTQPLRRASGTPVSARRTPRRTPANEKLVGVIGTFNSGCAAIEIPVLNQAPGGGVAMISPANTYVCLTEGGPGCDATEPDKYYPAGTRNYARVVANDAYQGAAVAEFAKDAGRHERLHPERQGGVRPRRRDELQERGGERRDQGRRLRGLGSEGVELRGAVPQDRRHRRGRSVPRRADRRERRPGDQGQGRRARCERRQGQAVRAGRIHDAADDRRGARGGSGHVPERRRRADRQVPGQGRRVRRGVQAAARRQGDRPVRDLRCAGGARSCSMRSRRRTARGPT